MPRPVMRYLLLVFMLSLVSCTRKVSVVTAPSALVATSSLKVTNATAQPVSIYVTASGSEIFLKQVPANATELVPVRGVADGATVRLRATMADGSRSFTRDGVVLSGVYEWKLP